MNSLTPNRNQKIIVESNSLDLSVFRGKRPATIGALLGAMQTSAAVSASAEL